MELNSTDVKAKMNQDVVPKPCGLCAWMGFPFVDVRTTFKGIPCSYPQAIQTDNGPEFTCRVFMAWMRSRGVEHIAFPRLHTLQCIEAKAKYQAAHKPNRIS